MKRIGLVVHPTRSIDIPLEILREWADARDLELVQVPTSADEERTVDGAEFGEVQGCDLVAAIGGDGTVLTALRVAAPKGTPVLGVACGSLGALSAVTAEGLEDALGAFESGDWTRRDLPALDVNVDGERVAWALNDFVLVRRAGQLAVDITVADELYARTSGDGLIVATALGSSAYSMAAGGPLLVAGTSVFVVTPLAPHGGSTPPLVVPSEAALTLEAHPGYSGFDVEIDGHRADVEGTKFTLTMAEARATLVALGDPGQGLTPLRRRSLIIDSPRVLARDARERLAAHAQEGG
ncbi:MAG: kinase [Thermoleophilaceae bacterium]|nr:kinase [Thermoleophilaceae bacterium]